MTAVCFPDISTTSEQGFYIAEARSPDNGTINQQDVSPPDESSFGFQCRQWQEHFRYQLIDAKSTIVIWERWQQSGEPSPRDLFVSDEGWVVIHTQGRVGDDLISISPAGRRTLVVEVSPGPKRPDIGLEALPSDKPGHACVRSEHVHPTTAGLVWTWGSIQYFVAINGQPHFVFSTAWGDRIIIDLEAGVLVEPTHDVIAACVEREQELIPRYLEYASANMVDDDQRDDDDDEEHDDASKASFRWGDVVGMLATAIRIKAKGAIPLLHAVMKRRILGDWTACGALPEDYFVASYAFRPLATLAIRVCGGQPEGYACHTFFREDISRDKEKEEKTFLDLPDVVRNRDELINAIAPAMDSRCVLKTIGAPDYVEAFSVKGKRRYIWGEHWEYYYGIGRTISSLRITWKEGTGGQEMARLKHISPMPPRYIEQRVTRLATCP